MIQKKTTKSCLCLFAAGIMILALTGFNTPTKPKKQPLVVERQECVLQHMIGGIPSEDCDIGINIDVPVGGDPVLVDSVMRFLNREIYEFFEPSYHLRFSQEEVYCADAKHLLSHYKDAYKPFFIDTCYRVDNPPCCTNGHHLSVTMEEQTKSFVTYQVRVLHIGEGDCEYLEWTTFDKSDGHRLAEVIGADRVDGFVMEKCGVDDAQNRLSSGADVAWRFSFGLTTDSLRVQYLYAPGIVEDLLFDMKKARPYLTDEAKRLLE